MLRQTSMYLGKGIIIGTINRLQLNKWAADWLIEGGVWQLIAIFGKRNKGMVWEPAQPPKKT